MIAAATRRLSLWLVLVAFLALTVYGFLQGNLLHHETWTVTGLKRVLIFAACYTLCFAALSMWQPGLFLTAVFVTAAVYTTVAFGPIPILTVGTILLSSLVLGQAILARLGIFDAGSVSGAITAMLLGLGIYMGAVGIAALMPLNYPALYLAVLAAPLLWNFRLTMGWLAKIPSLLKPVPLTRTQHAAAGLLTFVLLLHWLAALEPEAGADGLAVHLVVPSSVALDRQWAFDVTKHLWAVMPMGADWCFTAAYLLGGEAAARLLNLAFFLSLTVLLLSIVGKWLPLAPALLTVTLFAATPLVQLVTGSLFAENLWALLALGALLSLSRYREGGPDARLYLAFVLLGAAVSTKFGALAFLPPFILISLWTLFRGPRTESAAAIAKTASIALACFLCFAAQPYLTALMKTGNPVFPYLPAVFPSRYAVAAGSGSPSGPREHLTWSTLYDLTFHTSRFWEVQDGAFGFQYLLFLPLSILLLRRTNWPDLALLSGFALLLFAPVTLRMFPDVRYLYPGLSLATLFIAAALSAIRGVDGWLYRSALVLAGAVVLGDLYFLPSSSWIFKDFVSNPASRRARAEFITAHAPERNLVAYLNRVHPGAPVAFFETSSIAELQGPAFTTTWHNLEFYNRILGSNSASACFHVLQDYGIHLVVAPSPGSGVPVTTTPIEGFLQHCTDPETRSGNFYAGRVKDACSGAWDEPGPPAPAGEYDDPDPRILYSGVWARGRFAAATRGTLTYSNAPGATLVFSFDGNEVMYVYTKAFNRGIAEIAIDGASQGALDLYAPSAEWKTATPFRANGPGRHALLIRVTGRKNPSARDAFIDVDMLVVR